MKKSATMMVSGAVFSSLFVAYLYGYLWIPEPQAYSLLRLIAAVGLLCALLLLATGMACYRIERETYAARQGGKAKARSPR